MDPNLFRQDYERLFEALTTIIVLAFFVERALSLVFEHRYYIARFEDRGFKAPLAFLVALGVCVYWDFDALSIVVLRERTQFLGHVVTAAVIAGGSKAAITLFHNVFGAMSDAEKQRKNLSAAMRRSGLDV